MANVFNERELNFFVNNFLVGEIENASVNERPLSPFEKFMYVYTFVTGKGIDLEDGVLDFQSTQDNKIAPLFKRTGKDITNQLAEICEMLGIQTSKIASRKVVKNFAKSKKPAGKRNGLLVSLDDNVYDIHGVFYSDPNYDSLNPRSASVCHALMNLSEVESLLSKNGKFEFVNAELSELENQLKILKNDNEDIVTSFEELKSKLLSDETFKNNLVDFIERFIDDVYTMKARDKSVNRVLHPYFGEGDLPYSDGVSKTMQDVFLALFKMACRSKLSIASKDLPNPARQELMSHYDELDRELASGKRMVKIFSENYSGITPHVFKDTMIEAIYDGDYFSEGSPYAEEFNFVLEGQDLVKRNEFFEKLKKEKDENISLEKFETAIKNIMLANGFGEESTNEVVNTIMFSSGLTASQRWYVEATNSTNPFAQIVQNSQKTKY